MPDLLASFISIANPSGAEPVPDSALVNETQNLGVKIEPGKRYKFRIINMGAFAAQYVWFEGHTMQVIEVDGVYTEPADAEMIYVTVAQRWSVIITAKNDTNANFAFVGSMDEVRTLSLSCDFLSLDPLKIFPQAPYCLSNLHVLTITSTGPFRFSSRWPESQCDGMARV